jgi:hypothetical protein
LTLGDIARIVDGMAEVMPGTDGVLEMEAAPVQAAFKRMTPTSILASMWFTDDRLAPALESIFGEDQTEVKEVPSRRVTSSVSGQLGIL